jgi:hypothetical protein
MFLCNAFIAHILQLKDFQLRLPLEDAKAGLHYSIHNTREAQELLAVKPPNVESNLEVSKNCAFLCDFPGLQSKCKDGFQQTLTILDRSTRAGKASWTGERSVMARAPRMVLDSTRSAAWVSGVAT